MIQQYKIDVNTYHYDNDHYEEETKTLTFSSLEEAFKAQSYLRWLPYENEFSYSHKKSFSFHYSDLDGNDWPLIQLDIWLGGVFQSDFDVYSERVVRTVYEKEKQ